MSRTRGIGEKLTYAYNPLPSVKDQELLDEAGLSLRSPVPGEPFAITWQYGSGLGAETIMLGPGESLPLRNSEAAEFMKVWRDMGFVLIDDPTDDGEVKDKSKAGLEKAVRFYADRGAKRLTGIQRTHGYTEEEMKRLQDEHWTYYYNQAKADLLIAAVQKLRLPAPKTAKDK